MKAIQVTGPKSAPQIALTDSLPKPMPAGADILVKVHAAGITADETTWPELYHSSTRVPGHDVSGVVEALGPDYDGPLSPGDEVYAVLRAAADQGGQAEYVVVGASDDIAPKPGSVSHAQAAALPIPALTAWEAIHEHAKLERGARVLVTGASGAVGLMVVQLARCLFDAEVVGLASPQNHALLRERGVSRVVDYNSPDWQDGIRGVDAVFDTAGGETLSKTWETVKEGGVVVTVADPPPPWATEGVQPEELRDHPGVRWVYFVVSSSRGLLARIGALLDEGAVRPVPVKVFEAERGLEAWEYAAQRGREGKAVIQFV
ncbi:hypothetical protein VUR80DRAFT_1442 [Thermomyces stellatus]